MISSQTGLCFYLFASTQYITKFYIIIPTIPTDFVSWLLGVRQDSMHIIYKDKIISIFNNLLEMTMTMLTIATTGPLATCFTNPGKNGKWLKSA